MDEVGVASSSGGHVRVPYDEYEQLMQMKGQMLAYGSPSTAVNDGKPVTFGLIVWDAEWDKWEYTRIVEVRMGENGILIVMGVSPVDDAVITAVAAYHPGGWMKWEVFSPETASEE